MSGWTDVIPTACVGLALSRNLVVTLAFFFCHVTISQLGRSKAMVDGDAADAADGLAYVRHVA